MNPLAVTFLPFLLYALASYAWFEITNRHLPALFLPARWIWTLGIVMVVFGIVRNLPIYPFNLLAPGAMLHP